MEGRADSCCLFTRVSGLTPPTTPPYKPAEEDLYKPDIPQEAGNEDSMAPSPGARSTGDTGASQKAPKKQPERTELLAHLSRAAEQPGMLKRPFSCSFGDHDYCQVLKPEATLQRKVLKSWEPLGQTEMEHKRRVPDAHYQGLDLSSKEAAGEMVWKDGVKQLRDQEIRASLTKHFGLLDSALDSEDMAFCKTPEYDTVFDDSCSESGSPVEEEEEEDEEEEEHCDSPLDTKLCLRRNPLSRTSLHYCSRSRSSLGSSCCRSRSPTSRRTFRYGWAAEGLAACSSSGGTHSCRNLILATAGDGPGLDGPLVRHGMVAVPSLAAAGRWCGSPGGPRSQFCPKALHDSTGSLWSEYKDAN